jgi:hypothetical protein
MSVGAMKDSKLKLRNLHASHTLGCGPWSLPVTLPFKCSSTKKKSPQIDGPGSGQTFYYVVPFDQPLRNQ